MSRTKKRSRLSYYKMPKHFDIVINSKNELNECLKN